MRVSIACFRALVLVLAALFALWQWLFVFARADSSDTDVQHAGANTVLLSVIFVRGSGSTLLQALINGGAPEDAHMLDEPSAARVAELERREDAEMSRFALFAHKSKIGQLSSAQREALASGTFNSRVVLLHRLDAFRHVIGVCRQVYH